VAAIPGEKLLTPSCAALRSLGKIEPGLEEIMSGINGDKSRFHRLRKQKIQRRMRNRVMYGQLNMGEAGKTSLKTAAAEPAGKRNDAARE
jgi:hypothetical protein